MSAHADLLIVSPLLSLPIAAVMVVAITRGPRWLLRRFGIGGGL